MGWLAIATTAVEVGADLVGGGGEDRTFFTWRGVQVACEGCDCIHPELIYQAVLAASPDEIAALANRWGGTLPGPTGRQYGSETLEQSVARLSFHSGGGRGCNFNDGETWRRRWIEEKISKYNITSQYGGTSPTPVATPTEETSGGGSVTQELEDLFRDILDVPIESVRAGAEAAVETTRQRASQASTAAQLSQTQLLLIAGGIGLVGYVLARRSG